MTITLLAAPVVRDPKWSDRGLCRYEDADLWFPDGTTNMYALAQTAEAKRICGLCPVRRDCLNAVMEREGATKPTSRFGIYAALDPDERYRLHRRSASKAAAE